MLYVVRDLDDIMRMEAEWNVNDYEYAKSLRMLINFVAVAFEVLGV